MPEIILSDYFSAMNQKIKRVSTGAIMNGGIDVTIRIASEFKENQPGKLPGVVTGRSPF